MRLLRRSHKKFAIALMVLNIGGVSRAVTVNDSCERCRSFFAPPQIFKAIARAVTRQDWKKSAPRSLGRSHNHSQTHDIESLRDTYRVAIITVSVPSPITIDSKSSRAGPDMAWRGTADRSPGQPLQLQI